VAAGFAAAYVVLYAGSWGLVQLLDTSLRVTVLPYYGIMNLACGLIAGVLALIALIGKRERSWLIWLCLLPGASALLLILGNLLLQEPSSPPALEPAAPPVLTADARPMVIDTDMAADDWLAILYLLSRRDVDVKAITVTGTGEAHCSAGTRNALDLAALAGRPGIPVACGREIPLNGEHAFPDGWRESVDGLFGLSLPRNPASPAVESAPDLLTRLVLASDGEMQIVSLGPLTNLAEALQATPALADSIERITIMGGAVNVPGNIHPDTGIQNAVAEWNIYVDPQAAAIVFASGAPITLVPLDATNQVPLTLDFYARLKRDRNTAAAEFVFQMLTVIEESIRSGSYYFWDPLAAAINTEGKLASFMDIRLLVITDEGAESGRTLADDTGTSIQVALDVDRVRFETLFLDTINGRGP